MRQGGQRTIGFNKTEDVTFHMQAMIPDDFECL